MIHGQHKGVNYTITQEAYDDLMNMYNINAIDEIVRAIDLEINQLESTVVIENNTAKLSITKK